MEGKDELGFQVVARTLNASIFNDLKLRSSQIGIQKLQLEQPSADFGNNAPPPQMKLFHCFQTTLTGHCPKLGGSITRQMA